VFQTAGTIHIPKTIPHQILDFPVFILFFQSYNQIFTMSDLADIPMIIHSIYLLLPITKRQKFAYGDLQVA
jgi:hypothetical protein